jgi:transcriptional regulator with XRE-family HTH domain
MMPGSLEIHVSRSPDLVDKHIGRRIRMRRLTLDMSQTALGHALGVTFQQVQKYEIGVNRISASRLHQMANVLQVPVLFFFDGLPTNSGGSKGRAAGLLLTYVDDFLATADGLSLVKAFMQIENRKLRTAIVDLIERVAGDER